MDPDHVHHCPIFFIYSAYVEIIVTEEEDQDVVEGMAESIEPEVIDVSQWLTIDKTRKRATLSTQFEEKEKDIAIVVYAQIWGESQYQSFSHSTKIHIFENEIEEEEVIEREREFEFVPDVTVAPAQVEELIEIEDREPVYDFLV